MQYQHVSPIDGHCAAVLATCYARYCYLKSYIAAPAWPVLFISQKAYFISFLPSTTLGVAPNVALKGWFILNVEGAVPMPVYQFAGFAYPILVYFLPEFIKALTVQVGAT